MADSSSLLTRPKDKSNKWCGQQAAWQKPSCYQLIGSGDKMADFLEQKYSEAMQS